MRVAGMRPVAQRVDNPRINARERFECMLFKVADIAAIGQRTKPEALRHNGPVLLVKRVHWDGTAPPLNGKGQEGTRDGVRDADRRIGAVVGRLEAIVEPPHDGLHCLWSRIDWNPLFRHMGHQPQIIETMQLVGMLVRDQDRIEPRLARSQQGEELALPAPAVVYYVMALALWREEWEAQRETFYRAVQAAVDAEAQP